MSIDVLNSIPFTISPKAYLERSYYRKTKGHKLKVLSTEPLDVYIISEQELSNYKNKKPFKYIASFLNVKDSGKGLVFNVDEDFTLILENNSDKAAGGGFNMYDLQNQQPSYDQQIAGNHIYQRCPDCGKMVRTTGWFAGWHICE